MTFAEALEEVEKGNRVTRLEWGNADEYFFKASDGFLSIHHAGEGKMTHRTLVKDGDYLASDWMLVQENIVTNEGN